MAIGKNPVSFLSSYLDADRCFNRRYKFCHHEKGKTQTLKFPLLSIDNDNEFLAFIVHMVITRGLGLNGC